MERNKWNDPLKHSHPCFVLNMRVILQKICVNSSVFFKHGNKHDSFFQEEEKTQQWRDYWLSYKICCLPTLIYVYFAKFKLPAYQLKNRPIYITTTWIVKRLKLELYGELNGFEGNKRQYGVTSVVHIL